MVDPRTLADLRSITVFDEVIYLEAVSLFAALTPETYCRYGSILLSPPSPGERIDVTAGLRAIMHSPVVLAATSDGALPVALFYLVTLCEGVLMPHLQPLLDLAQQRGCLGPANASGRYDELERARASLGPAIGFLGTHGQPALLTDAPTIANRLAGYHAARLSRLRNAIAHFKFRLEPVRVALRNHPDYPQAERTRARFERALEWFLSMLRIHNPHRGEVIDFDRSVLRYEGNLDRQLTSRSSSMTFKEVRDLVTDIERLANNLALAYVEAGGHFGNRILFCSCLHCREGHVVVPVGLQRAVCPACGVESDVPSLRP